jgi:hypothetical protein
MKNIKNIINPFYLPESKKYKKPEEYKSLAEFEKANNKLTNLQNFQTNYGQLLGVLSAVIISIGIGLSLNALLLSGVLAFPVAFYLSTQGSLMKADEGKMQSSHMHYNFRNIKAPNAQPDVCNTIQLNEVKHTEVNKIIANDKKNILNNQVPEVSAQRNAL